MPLRRSQCCRRSPPGALARSRLLSTIWLGNAGMVEGGFTSRTGDGIITPRR
jgi:hypothetical protein